MACCSARRAGLRGREAGKCDDCRTWEEELYWKRFQPLHFCQILDWGSEFHKQLMIPRKFADNARAILPPKVTLRGPSGASWHAIMMAKDDDLFLSDGWEEFVRAYSLQASNILLFKYDGVSVFDVLIFDGENRCEKESAYFVKKCGHENSLTEHQRKRVSSEAVLEENDDNHIHEEATKQAKQEVGKNSKRLKYSKSGRSRREKLVPREAESSKANPSKTVPLTSSENLEESFAMLAELGKSIVQNATSILEPENATDINGNCAIEAPNQNNTPQVNGCFSTVASPQSREEVVSARGRPKNALGSPGEQQQSSVPNGKCQTKASRKKVTSPVGKLKSKQGATKEIVPFGSADSSSRMYVSEAGKVALEMARKEMTESGFVVVMRPTSVYRRFIVTVPPAWYKKYLTPKSQDVFLRVEDKTWHTRVSYSPCKATGQICGGWKQFVQENQLEQFDVCLFNLASQKDDAVMLDVSIFRAGPTMAIPLSQVMDEPSMI